MKRLMRKFKRTNKVSRIVYLLTAGLYIVSYLFFAKSVISLVGIETLIRYVVLLLFLAFLVVYIYVGFCKLINKKYLLFSVLTVFSVLFIIVFSGGSYVINFFHNKLSQFNENDKVVYTSYLISLSDTTINSKSEFGMVEDKESIEGYVLANEIIKEHKLTQEVKLYSNEVDDVYLTMLNDLYEGKIDAIFISSNYVTLYSDYEGYENIASETKVVYQKRGEYKNKDKEIQSDKSLTEPFSVLIMGVDSEFEGVNANSAFNGDTLILATFNPNTLSATLLSIPRDTYVPIACRKNKYAKINSSAAAGTSCVIDTIENLVDIKIDYYAKINFKGVVSLIDAVNGVEVNVEKPDFTINHGHDCKGYVCEQNSDRKWGKDTIYISPGMQTLNGEQALAYARCRDLYIGSDLARNRHQQDIIMGLGNKIIRLDSYTQVEDILDAISNNIATNMSVNQILSSYNILKDMVVNVIQDEEIIEIQKATLETYALDVYLPGSGRITKALGYYEDSLDDIIKTMKVNLEIEKPEKIKTFSYSLNETYEAKVAGQGLRSGASNSVLSSFVGKKKTEAEYYCNKNNFNCSFRYVDENSQYYNPNIDIDLIVSQNPHEGTLLKEVKDITFYINGASSLSE